MGSHLASFSTFDVVLLIGRLSEHFEFEDILGPHDAGVQKRETAVALPL